MKKIKYLIITLIITVLLIVSNVLIKSITNNNFLISFYNSKIANLFRSNEVNSYSASDENVFLNSKAKWYEKNKVEIEFEISNNFYNNDKNKDLIFMIDSSLFESNNSFKNTIINFLPQILNNSNNRISTIIFNSDAKKIHEFSNDIETIRVSFDKVVHNNDNVNYNNALNELDKLLSNYNKKNDSEVVVLFIGDRNATKDIISHKSTYDMLKEKYPYLSIDGIMCNSNDIQIKDIKDVSDRHYSANIDEITNILTYILNSGKHLEELVVTLNLNDSFDYLGSNTKNGDISVENNKVTWKLNNKHLIGGKDSLKLYLELKEKNQTKIDYYTINDKTDIKYKYNTFNNTFSSNESLVLKNGFKVTYNLNLPDGCSIPKIEDESYIVYSKVNLKDDIYCDGYQFLGYKVANADMINDRTFIMADEDVIVNASWSNISITANLDGTVREKLTLYRKMEELSKNTQIVKQYTGNHKDSFELPATKNIYHFYAEDDIQASEVLNNNNVLFSNHCWQIIRTTDTGGVKMIYNGEADSEGKCGTNREKHVGYYDTTNTKLNSEYYYGTNFEYDSATKKFKLSGDLVKEKLSDTTAPSLMGKYTCKSSLIDGTCSTLYLLESHIGESDAYAIVLNSNSHYSQIGTMPFYSQINSPSNSGYMSGKKYTASNVEYKKTDTLVEGKIFTIKKQSVCNNCFYFKSVVYNESESSYVAANGVQPGLNGKDPSTLIGMYTYLKTTTPTTWYGYIYRIVDVKDNQLYLLEYKGGEVAKDHVFGNSIIDNKDGTYTLKDTITADYYKEWNNNPSKYKGMYTCSSDSDTCSNPKHIIYSANSYYEYMNVLDEEELIIAKSREGRQLKDTLLISNYELLKNKDLYGDYKYMCKAENGNCLENTFKIITSIKTSGYTYVSQFQYFGSDIKYENGKYTLINTLGPEALTDLSNISTHHYTCLDGEKECEKVAYIFKIESSFYYYIILQDGDTDIKNELDNMLNENLSNSNVKTALEAWYEKNLINYSTYLEDAIFCNDTSYINYENSGWNPNGGDINQNLEFKEVNFTKDLSCLKQTDQFSTNNDLAKLKYPIGLATSPEMNLLNNDLIRKTGNMYWLGSNNKFYISKGIVTTRVNAVTAAGLMSEYSDNSGYGQGLRPTISLNADVEYSNGNGSVDSPYVIE